MVKLLFVTTNMASGGVQKSLVSLLNCLDYSKYSVDLMLFINDGLFRELLPPNVRIIDLDPCYRPLKKSVAQLIINKKPVSAFWRCYYSFEKKRYRNSDMLENKGWKALKRLLPRFDTKYDIAIAYGDGELVPYTMEMVDAKKKIVWNHIDYLQFHLNKNFDLQYYNQSDAIVTMSHSCKNILTQVFPENCKKMCVIENIISRSLIEKMSLQDIEFDSGFTGKRIITIGRLSKQKALDKAIDALYILKKRGHEVRWYILGVGEDYEELTRKVAELSLEQDFIFLGEQLNPYAFVKKSDVYVQTSIYEGKPVAIEEAKCLGMPIVSTNYPTVIDSIVDQKSGLIVGMTPEEIADGIELLLDNSMLRNCIGKYNLEHSSSNEESIVQAFDKLIEGLYRDTENGKSNQTGSRI